MSTDPTTAPAGSDGVAGHPVAETVRLRRLGIDTYQEPVIFMPADCAVCRSEGWAAQSRVRITHGDHVIIATLNVVTGDLLADGEAGLSDVAWRMLAARDGDQLVLDPPDPLVSLRAVRAKVYGRRFATDDLRAVVQDIAAGRYSTIELAAFVTASAARGLDLAETTDLTRAMLEAGAQLTWERAPVVDKHCVGGLPGNRTTMIVVPIVAACGLLMPKTSSRAITSPAGTADAMETVAPVTLDLQHMRRVVEQEGACVVWGGSVNLSPADDLIIRVERPLDIDSEAQLVASVLSKKAAAGSTHVVIDIPVGPTAKVRAADAARRLSASLAEVGRAIGLVVQVVLSDGRQPVGRGVGPALEARDVLAVLRGEAEAPPDLRDRALTLAAALLEIGAAAPPGSGREMAERCLVQGGAWRKFQAICEAQGGMREPPRAVLTQPVLSVRPGRIVGIDNRRLARVAKLAGAPASPAAGLEMHAVIGQRVAIGEPLYTVHSQTPGELQYALAYVRRNRDIHILEEFS